MAEDAELANGDVNIVCHDLKSLLCTDERDFLLRKNGDEVKIGDLGAKIVGLYFSAHWCGPCRRFTPNFAEVYEELSPKGDFEVVFISADESEESFHSYFSEMPWLAIPFSDSEIRDRLNKLFEVMGIPHLVILDGKGKVLTDDGVSIISEYEAEAYPFTPDRVKELKEEEEAEKKEQSLRSLLVSRSRDFLISNDGNEVLVSEVEGKMVGLYFSLNGYKSCHEFTPKLVEIYDKLKEKGESFEVVLICLDDDKESFNQGFGSMPWLALPFKDKSCGKLARYFELQMIPALVIIGPDGKTLNSNVVELIESHGIQAYPFTSEKLAELAEIEKARLEAQTLDSLLVSGERDFVIGKGAIKVLVSELVGKNILLYFSAHWCPPCRAFTPKLIKAYHEMKAKDSAFEVIFISSDRDQDSFEEYYSTMPWLALPFGDQRKTCLSRTFKIRGIPSLVAIGPTGRTVTTEARDLLMTYGSDAYPFTKERLKELETQLEEMATGWPEKVKHVLHPDHELVLSCRSGYVCDKCEESGYKWSFYCKECDFDLHPKCALEGVENEEHGDTGHGHHDDDGHANGGDLEQVTKDGIICDGEVCYRA